MLSFVLKREGEAVKEGSQLQKAFLLLGMLKMEILLKMFGAIFSFSLLKFFPLDLHSFK